MKRFQTFCLSFSLLVLFAGSGFAQNPIVRTMYSADPSARVFGDRVFLFPSHDILATPGKGRVGWFCMEDYHVFSSANLTDWTDHGVVVTQNKIPWVKPDSYSMWAPDCIYRNGKYYFYFPTTPKDSTISRGFTVGVATADKPEGPYTPQPTPIKGVRGIDPNVIIDKNGQAYLYWSQGNIYAAKLKENMLELASDPVILKDLPTQGLKEGPYVFERNGIYYLTFPHVGSKTTERLEYAMSNNPLGPFKMTGVIMDESPSGCWTNHHSVIQFKNQWYLFYHDKDYSPNFDKARSVKADSLFFNADGTIKKVIPTLRGVGVTNAASPIQIDRYSAKSADAAIDFLDTMNRFLGWKTIFSKPNDWVQYNTVDFGKKPLKTISVRAMSEAGGTLQIHTNSSNGPVIAEVKIPKGNNWKETKAPVTKSPSGIQNLFVVSKDGKQVEADWIKFE